MQSFDSFVRGPGSYVVLIPSPDGSIGRVTVQGKLGQQVLTKDGQIALLDGSAVPIDLAVSKQQIERDFTIAARPPIPPRKSTASMVGDRSSTSISGDCSSASGGASRSQAGPARATQKQISATARRAHHR